MHNPSEVHAVFGNIFAEFLGDFGKMFRGFGAIWLKGG
jgi:hypothetical protein